jgi:hypothetical protein
LFLTNNFQRPKSNPSYEEKAIGTETKRHIDYAQALNAGEDARQ